MDNENLKLISWNIDSINSALNPKSERAILTFELLEKISSMNPDIFMIQETKVKKIGLDNDQIDAINKLFPGYIIYNNPSTSKSGYSGTMILSKNKANNFEKAKIGAPETMDEEGRITTLEFDDFYAISVYTPNSGSGLKRLSARQVWDEKFNQYVSKLKEKKSVIFTGDLNVAYQPIDLKNPEENHYSAGFTDEEREDFGNILSSGFIDTFRTLHPNETGAYTWFSQRIKTSKKNNSGWRIDYFMISSDLENNLISSEIMDSGKRSDHVPIIMYLKK